MALEVNPCLANRFFKSSPSLSFPITEHKIGIPPMALMFKATFPAPPNLESNEVTSTTGTGASGETLSTLPMI